MEIIPPNMARMKISASFSYGMDAPAFEKPQNIAVEHGQTCVTLLICMNLVMNHPPDAPMEVHEHEKKFLGTSTTQPAACTHPQLYHLACYYFVFFCSLFSFAPMKGIHSVWSNFSTRFRLLPLYNLDLNANNVNWNRRFPIFGSHAIAVIVNAHLCSVFSWNALLSHKNTCERIDPQPLIKQRLRKKKLTL